MKRSSDWVVLVLNAKVLGPLPRKPKTQINTVTDIDGNIYQTIKIGQQTWMAENLRVTRNRNGDPIPYVTNHFAWDDLSTGAYCAYTMMKT
ncbi:MAG: hypothetical protein MI922_01485, partial [Bacteroidales bacterium]|nr:hypothetical protein [Bacteroidales bacterium]